MIIKRNNHRRSSQVAANPNLISSTTDMSHDRAKYRVSFSCRNWHHYFTRVQYPTDKKKEALYSLTVFHHNYRNQHKKKREKRKKQTSLLTFTYREACRVVERGRCGSGFLPLARCSSPLWSTGTPPHNDPSWSFYGISGPP